MSRILSAAAFGALAALTVLPAAAQQGLPDIAHLTPQQVALIDAGEPFGDDAVAERHGLPDPEWALEHAETLQLAPDQVAAIDRLHDAMIDDAREIGARYLALEAALDEQFRSGRARPGGIRKQIAEIGALRAQLRSIHLEARLAMRMHLTRDQLDAYAQTIAAGG